MANIDYVKNAWLNLTQEEYEGSFNTYDFMLNGSEDFHYRLSYIMSNPEYFSFTVKSVLGIELLPIQCAILEEIWKRKFPMLIATRGFSKSYMLSIYSILRALLLDGRKIVIVGGGFRQSKILFEYMETMWNNSPLLRSMCDDRSGPKKDTDRYSLRINNSIIVALPLGDGSRIRGQRAHDIISDEFACLQKGSLVETGNGLIRIEDFDSARGIYLPTGDNINKYESPSKFIKTPKTDVYEVKLENGYVIRCSNKHQLMTPNGWKNVLSLQDGDWIEKTPKNISKKFGDDNIDKNIAWLLGVLISEGSIVDRKRISISTTDFNLVKKIVKIFGWKFSERPAYIDKRGWVCKKSYTIYTDDEIFRNKLYLLGLDYSYAEDKIIPYSILKSNKKTLLHFLNGLFDGDGSCFYWKDRGKENLIGLAYYSVSERLCRDVQIIANKLGFDGYINNRDSEISNKKQWFVRWNNENALEFSKLLKINRFENILNNCQIPKKPKHITYDKSRNKWKVQIKYLDKFIQKRFKTKIEAEDFLEIIKNKIQYSKIVSIKKLDIKEHLYDYYLPITHSFYAEGYRQHNTIPKDIFETVVSGFGVVSSSPIEGVKKAAAKKKAEEEGIILEKEQLDYYGSTIPNQIILSGTAYYDFNHFADYWKKWRKIIKSKGDISKLGEIFSEGVPPNFKWSDYSVIRIPYELVPEGFMDPEMVARSKATVHSGIYMMEYGAVFTKDSQGFFKRSLIQSCVPSIDNIMRDSKNEEINFNSLLIGDKNKKYIFGVDPASEVDNFSIVIIELNGDHRRVVYCWTTNRSQHKDLQKVGLSTEKDFYAYCTRKIRDLMKRFPCYRIAMDAQGGGIAIMEALHDSDKIQEGENLIWPVIDEDKPSDTDDEKGLHILEMCQFAKYEWLAEANHGLKKDLEDKVLIFPSFDNSTIGLATADDILKSRTNDTLEDCVLDIEELKEELSLIEMSQTPNGRDKWDTPEVILGAGKKKRLRKDRYSSLLMANMAARIIDRTKTPEEYQFYGGFSDSLGKSKGSSPNQKMYNAPNWFSDSMNGVYY
jgi:hypothetical protein